jgi:sugar lactone lactonase YvrE
MHSFRYRAFTGLMFLAFLVTGGSARAGVGDYYFSKTKLQPTQLWVAKDLAVDKNGKIYFVDWIYWVISTADAQGNVALLAGYPGRQGTTDGKGDAARFNLPRAVAVDRSGVVYVADAGSGIRKISTDKTVTTLVASSVLNDPTTLRVGKSGNLFLLDGERSGRVRKVDPSGKVTTLANVYATLGFYPAGLAVDADDNVYISGRSGIWRAAAGTTKFKLYAGAVSDFPGEFADGPALEARFWQPRSLAVDDQRNLYVADNCTIRKVGADGVVSTLAGQVNQPDNVEGAGAAARFGSTCILACTPAGELYVLDSDYSAVLRGRSNVPTRPAIRKQPASEVARAGYRVAFRVAADGIPAALTYQWQRLPAGTDTWQNLKASSLYVGPASAELVVTSCAEKMNGDKFRCQISNGAGAAVVTSVVTLTVKAEASGYTFETIPLRYGLGATSATVAPTDGNAISARFYGPAAMIRTSAGNIIVAEMDGDTIRQITPSKTVTTLAGRFTLPEPSRGYADGVGTNARFDGPAGLAEDAAGNIWVADSNNNAVRMLAPNRKVTTVAGSQVVGAADGTGKAARFNQPMGIAIDKNGVAYVADYFNSTIRKVTAAGVVTTFAGTAGAVGMVNGKGKAARFANPSGLAFDQAGNLYVCDSGNHAIRKITRDGTVTTVAGTGGSAGWKDGPSLKAKFNQPRGVWADPSGVIYVADAGNQAVRAISNGTVRTLICGYIALSANSVQILAGKTDGSSWAARLDEPTAVLADSTGLLIAERGNNCIRRYTTGVASDFVVSTYLGNSAGIYGGAADVCSIAACQNGDVVVAAPAQGHEGGIMRITPKGVVTCLMDRNGSENFNCVAVDGADVIYAGLGNTSPGFCIVDSNGAQRSVSDDYRWVHNPVAFAFAPDGTIYMIMGNAIAQLAADVEEDSWAGISGMSGAEDGPRTDARFLDPSGIAVDGLGQVYVADTGNHTIRKIGLNGKVTTLAGKAGKSGSADGTGSAARFNHPMGMAVDRGGNLYVADSGNHLIRKITPSGKVTTIGGVAGQRGVANGLGKAARFNSPKAIAVDRNGNLYIADTGNSLVRRALIK